MNTKKNVYLLTYLLISSLIISLIGCEGSENKVLGKWRFEMVVGDRETKQWMKEEGSSVYIEFFKDKTYNSNNPLIANGKWIVLDDGRIKIAVSQPYAPVLFGNIRDNKLFIKIGSNEWIFIR
jgi:hypothetical protein